MKWFDNIFKKTSKPKSLFAGERLGIDKILTLKNSTAMIIELSYGLSDKIHYKGYDSLTQPEKVLNRVYWLESEINNGGFDQFFANSSGDYAIDTPAALEAIGAHHTAQLVKRAIDIFPGGLPPRDRQQRIEKMNMIDADTANQFENLTSEFLEYRDPLEELQYKYIVANKDQIQV